MELLFCTKAPFLLTYLNYDSFNIAATIKNTYYSDSSLLIIHQIINDKIIHW